MRRKLRADDWDPEWGPEPKWLLEVRLKKADQQRAKPREAGPRRRLDQIEGWLARRANAQRCTCDRTKPYPQGIDANCPVDGRKEKA